MDARQGEAGRRSTGFNGFLRATKVIPGKRLHVGPENQVGVALPGFELMLLGGADGPADNLKNVGGGAPVAVMNANRNGNNRCATQVACRLRRDGCDETSIGEAARADFDRFEQARESATRADGVNKASVCEDDRFTISQVGG